MNGSAGDGERARRVESLQRMAIFGGIVEPVIAALVERAPSIDVAPGDYFFRFGDRGQSAFVLETGRVAILRPHDGTDHLLRHLSAGDCFGEVALLDFGARSASVRAESECTAFELTAPSLAQVAKTDPTQFAMIYMNLGRELSRRLRDADRRMFEARFQARPAMHDWDFANG